MPIIEGTLHIIKSLPRSVNGNPRYLCGVATASEGLEIFRTAPDSGYAHDVEQLAKRRVQVHYEHVRGVPTLIAIREL